MSLRDVMCRCMHATTTENDLMSSLLIFFVKSVGAGPNDFSFIYSLTRLKSQASRIVTTNLLRRCWVYERRPWSAQWTQRRQRNPGNLLGFVQSLIISVRTSYVGSGEKATSLILYMRHLFRRTIYFLPHFHSVEFFISTFRQDKFKIAFFLWTTSATPTHRAWRSFSFGVFVINEQENWWVVFKQRTRHSLHWNTAHRSVAKWMASCLLA